MNSKRQVPTDRKTRPLRLARETIRVLGSHQLADVVGGRGLVATRACVSANCAPSADCQGISYAADCSIGAAAGGCG